MRTSEGDGFRAILFVDKQENLTQSFIVADKDVTWEIKKPTVTKTLAVLLACYFTFHREYPISYRNALQFLAHEIFKSDMKSNVAQKYLRNLKNSKK